MGTSRIRLLAILLVVLVGSSVAWYVAGPRSQAAPTTHGQGRALLDAVVQQVKSTYVRRDVTEDQLYAGAAKGLLEEAGAACAKTVNDPPPNAADGKGRFYALLERVEGRCPSADRTPTRLYLSAAKAMLESLGDQYTRLMEPEAFRMFIQDTQGFFFGIGIYIDVRDDYPIVVQPIANTPASRAGLRAGDRLVMVDGVSMKDIALQEAVTRIRGREGTPVKLRVRRGDEEFDVSIVRARISIVAAEGPESLDQATREELAREHIGYVKLVTFNHERADVEVDRFVKQARRSGAKALIFDMRNNGGGLLDQSIKIASRYVPTG
ncbi:MAG: S41 family peptidase, partial [bacterium]